MNVTDKQILEDGNRNAIVRIAATLDTSNLNLVSIIKPLDFINNAARLVLTGFRVDEIEYSIGPAMGAQMYWNGDSPQLIASMSKSGCFEFRDSGGLQPDSTRSAYDGSINVTTTGYAPGTPQNVTLMIKLVKLYRI